MIDPTKEQIKEVIERLQDYACWVFGTKASAENLSKRKTTHNGRQFSISIDEKGYYDVNLDNGAVCKFAARVVNYPSSADCIDNVNFEYSILNAEDLLPQDLAYSKEVSIFVMSLLQRTVAFNFLSRMTEQTVDELVKDLSQAGPKL